MSQSSKHFNRESFEEWLVDSQRVLDENDEAMATVTSIRRPGEIGAVAVKPSFELPPDEAA